MVDKVKAIEIAKKYLLSIEKETRIELVILEDHTIERGFGWVFFYNSKGYVAEGDEHQMLAGNAPFIVDRKDGTVHVTGTAKPTEFYIENYEQTGDPHRSGR